MIQNGEPKGGVLLGTPEANRLTGNRNNQVLDQDVQEDGSLHCREVYQTVRGEGPHSGWPAVVVRLSGCNLACWFCDAEYRLEPEHKRSSPQEILDLCQKMMLGGALAPLIVITGGEPFRQNIIPLVRLLLEKGALVEVETSGSLWLDDFPGDDAYVSLVVSPKTAKLHPEAHKHADAYLYVVRHGEMEKDGMPGGATQIFEEGGPPARPLRDDVPIYLQPLDEEGNMPPAPKGQVPNVSLRALNARAAVQGAMIWGHRISLRIHKMLSLS